MQPDDSAVDRRWFLAVVAAAFAFIALVGYPRQWSLGLQINDEFWYAHLARSVYAGLGYVSNVMYPLQAPSFAAFPVPEAMKQSGYPLVVAAVWQITGISVRAMLMIVAAGLALFSGLAFLLARHLGWSRPVAVAVAFASVVNPAVAPYGGQAMPESLYFAAFLLVMLLALRGSARALALAGAAHAALIIIKGHGIIYVPVLVGYLWLRGAAGLLAGLRPDARKLRAAATYVGMLFATLIVAHLVLPTGSVALFSSGGTYAYGFLIETGRATATLPYLDTEPTDAIGYILDHPAEYAEKVARQVRRTRVMLDDLGRPALSGILFPALLLSTLLLLIDALTPGKLLPDSPAGPAEREPYLLFAAVIAVTFVFFWPIYIVTRFITHPLPLMLLLCLYVVWRLSALLRPVPAPLARALTATAAVWFLLYPAAVTVWNAHRHPLQYIGSRLAVRFADLDRVAANVRERLPADPVIISEMAHEITWLTGARTILFPNTEADLRYLVARYDVDALYEHPLFPHDWPWMGAEFTLVDETDGRLWVRRRDR